MSRTASLRQGSRTRPVGRERHRSTGTFRLFESDSLDLGQRLG